MFKFFIFAIMESELISNTTSLVAFKVRVNNNELLCGKHTIENLFISDNSTFEITIEQMNKTISELNELEQKNESSSKHGKIDKGMLSPRCVNRMIMNYTDCIAVRIR